jgi:hypothetical protein
MKSFLLLIPVLIVCAIYTATPAHALSCLETSQYLKTIVGQDDTLIVRGVVTKTITDEGYTAEAVNVTDAYQGYVEEKALFYHQKDETWGYLCNNGPVGQSKSAVYVMTRNDAGQLWVSQTLDPQSDLAKNLLKQLAEEKITGEVVDFSATDRQNQIMTTIMDLFKQIAMLLKEHSYWATVK